MTDIGSRVRRLPADTRAALAFFSRLPVSAPPGAFDLHRSAGAWPLAGLIVALLPAALLLLASAIELSPLAAAFLAFALMAALTGAIHEDGLAGTFDGFGGGRTRAEKLAIMRDSRVGTYGALALLFVIAIKAASLAGIGPDAWHAAVALIGAAMVSRTLAIWHWNATLPARGDGLAWAAGRPDWLALLIAGVTGVVAAIFLLVIFDLHAVAGLLLAAVGAMLVSGLCRRQIGGHTGDTVGAIQQIAEALLLLGISAGRTPLFF
jgi:adenosylcobinamide-GDP ribazoletransferase